MRKTMPNDQGRNADVTNYGSPYVIPNKKLSDIASFMNKYIAMPNDVAREVSSPESYVSPSQMPTDYTESINHDGTLVKAPDSESTSVGSSKLVGLTENQNNSTENHDGTYVNMPDSESTGIGSTKLVPLESDENKEESVGTRIVRSVPDDKNSSDPVDKVVRGIPDDKGKVTAVGSNVTRSVPDNENKSESVVSEVMRSMPDDENKSEATGDKIVIGIPDLNQSPVASSSIPIIPDNENKEESVGRVLVTLTDGEFKEDPKTEYISTLPEGKIGESSSTKDPIFVPKDDSAHEISGNYTDPVKLTVVEVTGSTKLVGLEVTDKSASKDGVVKLPEGTNSTWTDNMPELPSDSNNGNPVGSSNPIGMIPNENHGSISSGYTSAVSMVPDEGKSELSDSYNSPVGLVKDSNTGSMSSIGYSSPIPIVTDSSSGGMTSDAYNNPVAMVPDADTQEGMSSEGYSGPISMSPDANTGTGIQSPGYTGPISMVENSNEGSGLSSPGYTGPISMMPDADTNPGMTSEGYVGPIGIVPDSNEGDGLKSPGYQGPLSMNPDANTQEGGVAIGYVDPVPMGPDADTQEGMSSLGYTGPIVMMPNSNEGNGGSSPGYSGPIGMNPDANEEEGGKSSGYSSPIGMNSGYYGSPNGNYDSPVGMNDGFTGSARGNYSSPVGMSGEDGKDGEEKLVELNVEDSDTSKYNGSIWDSAKLPPHQDNVSSSDNIKPSNEPNKATDLTSALKERYKKTASFYGIEGDTNRAISSVSKLMQIFGSYDQLGAAGEKANSIIMSALAKNNGFTDETWVPPHTIVALSDTGLLRQSAELAAAKLHGIAKVELIDKLLLEGNDSLLMAQKAMQTDPGRLPGAGGIFNGIKEVVNTVKNVISGLSDGRIDLGGKGVYNRPENKGSKTKPTNPEKIKEQALYKNNTKQVPFFNTYINTKGFKTTAKWLLNLGSVDYETVGSLDQLRKILTANKHYDLMTTYDKSNSTFGSVGLDSNHVWEIDFYPLVDKELNGGFTYLPSTKAINNHNYEDFKIYTAYSRWLPFTGFEMSTKKSTHRSLNLFDGDISYPVSLEFTNELRLTIADDQCKSFKYYFDNVLRAGTVELDKDGNTRIGFEEYAKYKDSSQNPAMYKNITFVCSIYIMKSDLATVKKFPLLVVLRDFQEEFVGDIEAGPTELALHFSIVGELTADESNRLYKTDMSERKDIITNNVIRSLDSKVNESLPKISPPSLSTPNVQLLEVKTK